MCTCIFNSRNHLLLFCSLSFARFMHMQTQHMHSSLGARPCRVATRAGCSGERPLQQQPHRHQAHGPRCAAEKDGRGGAACYTCANTTGMLSTHRVWCAGNGVQGVVWREWCGGCGGETGGGDGMVQYREEVGFCWGCL